jgi:hypothetical protein
MKAEGTILAVIAVAESVTIPSVNVVSAARGSFIKLIGSNMFGC